MAGSYNTVYLGLQRRKVPPEIRTNYSIAVKFDSTAKALETAVLLPVEENQEKHNYILQTINDQFGKNADVNKSGQAD